MIVILYLTTDLKPV